ncbi:MAG: TonB-dependent receptor, partial [Pseudomonadota bacterium]
VDDFRVKARVGTARRRGRIKVETAGLKAMRETAIDVDVWEFGLKSTLFDGRARANIAIFHQDLEDFQVLEFTGIRFQTFNVGKAQASGVEVETEAQLTDNLAANFNWTYSDANYPDDCDILDATAPGFNPNAANLCGASLTNAPENVVVAGATYEFDAVGLEWFANGNFRYESDRRTSTQPTEILSPVLLPGDIQEANTKVNLRVGVSSPDDRWTIELWGRNITDEQTKNVTFNIPLRGGEGARARGTFTQDPATYGVTLRTRF